MQQLFWVAWVSYHHLPKVCDSLQSRMLAGLLIADMLEPLWPAAALPLTLKGSFLQLPFILLFSGFPGHHLQYRQPVGPHLLFSKSLHFVSSRNPPAFLFFFFSFPFLVRLYLFLRHVQPFTAQRRSPRLASFPSCSRCAQMGKGMSLVSCSTRTQRKFSAVIGQVIYVSNLTLQLTERILLLLLLEK